MLNVQFINVPFITAFTLYPYSDTSSLGVSISGTYEPVPYALDNFDNYSIGNIFYVSGSGFWSASGFFIGKYNSFTDTFDGYSSGYITGYTLNLGLTQSGNSIYTGLFTGLTSGT